MNLDQEMESDRRSSHQQGQSWKYAYDPRDGAATRARTVWTPELGQRGDGLMCPRDGGHQGEDGVDTRARAARRGGPGCPRDGAATGARTSRKPGRGRWGEAVRGWWRRLTGLVRSDRGYSFFSWR